MWIKDDLIFVGGLVFAGLTGGWGIASVILILIERSY